VTLASAIHAIPAVLLIAAGVYALAAARRHVRGTTLVVAWIAAAVAVAGWAGVALLTPFAPALPSELFSHLWYGVSVAALCPPVAVLGARRPIDRAWPIFVVLPLVAVLTGPSLSTLWNHGLDAPLLVETPMLVGYLLVLVMCSGNYLGTRYTVAALLYAAAVVLVVLPSSSVGRTDWQSVLRFAGTICLAASLALARLSARRTAANIPDYDRLWLHFRDTFGVVWAKRVLERVNWSAREEHWPAELTFTGLAWKPGATEQERRQTIDRLQHTFGWLLKRFVNDDWIERKSEGRKVEGRKEVESRKVEGRKVETD
jgi:hypothetical protein